MENKLEKQIESILFWKAEPVSFSDLAKMLKAGEAQIKEALQNISARLTGGIVLIINNDEATLATSAESSEIIERLQKEELTKDLSRAALETLSIILYRGPMRRADIDYIRGVNSQFILRILLVRGLIDKKQDVNDERAFIYSASTNLLAHMGVQNIKDLPEYEQVNNDVASFLQTQKTEEKENVGENQAE